MVLRVALLVDLEGFDVALGLEVYLIDKALFQASAGLLRDLHWPWQLDVIAGRSHLHLGLLLLLLLVIILVVGGVVLTCGQGRDGRVVEELGIAVDLAIVMAEALLTVDVLVFHLVVGVLDALGTTFVRVCQLLSVWGVLAACYLDVGSGG